MRSPKKKKGGCRPFSPPIKGSPGKKGGGKFPLLGFPGGKNPKRGLGFFPPFLPMGILLGKNYPMGKWAWVGGNILFSLPFPKKTNKVEIKSTRIPKTRSLFFSPVFPLFFLIFFSLYSMARKRHHPGKKIFYLKKPLELETLDFCSFAFFFVGGLENLRQKNPQKRGVDNHPFCLLVIVG